MTDPIAILFTDEKSQQILLGSPSVRNVQGNVTVADGFDDALRRIAEQLFDLIVIYCNRRGAVSIAAVDNLQQKSPLSRLIVVTGPLCEGPWRRDSDVLRGVTLVPWHQWHDWLRSNVDRLGLHLPTSWSLPQTAARDELAEFWSRAGLPSSDGLVSIDAPERDSAEAIGDVVSLGGFAYSWHEGPGDSLVRGCDAVVVERNC